jgi:hypothetical protein
MELASLEHENETLATIESRTRLLTGGHKQQLDGGSAGDGDEDGAASSDEDGPGGAAAGQTSALSRALGNAVAQAAAAGELASLARGGGQLQLAATASTPTLLRGSPSSGPPVAAAAATSSAPSPPRRGLGSSASVGALMQTAPGSKLDSTAGAAAAADTSALDLVGYGGLGGGGDVNPILARARSAQLLSQPPPPAPQLSTVDTLEVNRIRELRRFIRAVRRSVAQRDFQRRQYTYMIARLRGNASVFERHMKGLDDAIKAARKELGDVQGYLRMLETSKDASILELHKFQIALQAERAARL